MVVVALALVIAFASNAVGIAALAQSSAPPRDQFVIMKTTKGTIVIRVYYSMVPYTAGNFLNMVNRGFYNGLTFHRVENWVVQGGDPNGDGTGHYVDPATGQPRFLKLEIHPRLNHNHAGVVAMARSASPNSASCQFYFLKRPSPFLNGKYSVFGQVVRGMEVVNSMQIGDRIVDAHIWRPQQQQEEGGAQSYSGEAEVREAVPGVAEPAAPPPPPPTNNGDAGF
jgi:peptidyl-prolyl cis-trans isomerase B (cyclophilin B)